MAALGPLAGYKIRRALGDARPPRWVGPGHRTQDRLYRMMNVAGIAYDEPDAQDAPRPIVAFFDSHLKPQTRPQP
jgi:hypothetical protein